MYAKYVNVSEHEMREREKRFDITVLYTAIVLRASYHRTVQFVHKETLGSE